MSSINWPVPIIVSGGDPSDLGGTDSGSFPGISSGKRPVVRELPKLAELCVGEVWNAYFAFLLGTFSRHRISDCSWRESRMLLLGCRGWFLTVSCEEPPHS